MEKRHGAFRLAACNGLARTHGLKTGQSLTEARLLFPGLRVGDINRAADHAALTRIAAACERFTPIAALDGADGVLLDVTGCAHLFGGEDALQKAMAEFMAGRGFTLRQAMAGGFACARVLARHGHTANAPSGGELAAVAGLPAAALDCEASIAAALNRAGLATIGDLASRPSRLLTARFGSGLTAKLARVLGREDMRLTPLRPAPAFFADVSFAEPVRHMDHVMPALARLIGRLCAEMERHSQGGRAFEASFFRADGGVRRLAIATAGPERDAGSLTRLFALRLDTLSDPLEAGFGFDAMRLCVPRSEVLEFRQTHLTRNQEARHSEADLVNRLNIRFSASRVLGFTAEDSHDPVRAAGAAPLAAAKPEAVWSMDGDSPPRPLQLFTPAQPIDVTAEAPDGPPILFRWRKAPHKVRAAEGPERIECEWWRSGRPVHDYYRVEDERGARFWIYREGLSTGAAPRWFLHGLFP